MHRLVPSPHRVVDLGPLVAEIDTGRKPVSVVLVDRDDDLHDNLGFRVRGLGSRGFWSIYKRRDLTSTGVGPRA